MFQSEKTLRTMFSLLILLCGLLIMQGSEVLVKGGGPPTLFDEVVETFKTEGFSMGITVLVVNLIAESFILSPFIIIAIVVKWIPYDGLHKLSEANKMMWIGGVIGATVALTVSSTILYILAWQEVYRDKPNQPLVFVLAFIVSFMLMVIGAGLGLGITKIYTLRRKKT